VTAENQTPEKKTTGQKIYTKTTTRILKKLTFYKESRKYGPDYGL